MNQQLTPKALGKQIRDRRKSARMTQEVAAAFCGITKKTLIRVEKGEDVYFSTIIKIITGLGIILKTEELGQSSNNNEGGADDEWF